MASTDLAALLAAGNTQPGGFYRGRAVLTPRDAVADTYSPRATDMATSSALASGRPRRRPRFSRDCSRAEEWRVGREADGATGLSVSDRMFAIVESA